MQANPDSGVGGPTPPCDGRFACVCRKGRVGDRHLEGQATVMEAKTMRVLIPEGNVWFHRLFQWKVTEEIV